MFRPLALYIGLRYTRAKRRDHFISFISLASMLGIALGVAVLITVLSVMNGFDYEIQNRLFNLANQVTISRLEGQVSNWPELAKEVEKQSGVAGVAPLINSQGMLTHMGFSAPVMASGILPDQEQKVSQMHTYMLQGNFDTLQPKSFNMVIGEGLAENLGLGLGDKVIMLTPQTSASPLGIIPRYKQFTVSGIFHVDGNPPMDNSLAFINLHDAQLLFQLGDAVTALRIKVNNLYAAPKVAEELQNHFPSGYIVSNWTQEYGLFFKSIRMEKTMIFLILLLIIAVAAFNLVSTLVMVVNDKQADIAILRTFGATPRTILATFIVQGFVVGLAGTILGFMGGILLAYNVTSVVNFLQNMLHVQFISSSVYFVDYLPSRPEWADIWQVCSIALGLSLLATIYPAWQASRTQPAEALRYE